MKKIISCLSSLLGINPAPVPSAKAPDWIWVDSDETTSVYYEKSTIIRKNSLIAVIVLINFLDADESEPYQSSTLQIGFDRADDFMTVGEVNHFSQPYATGDIVMHRPHDENNQAVYSIFSSDRGKMLFNLLTG